ncbi:hypothetical protein BS47DRAFT_1370092, partial [Hydnum rufescens UP504]
VLWYQDKVLIIHAWGLQATLGQTITLALALLTLLIPILVLAPILVLTPILILAPTLVLAPILVLTPVLRDIAPAPREIAPAPHDITPTPLDIAPTPHDITPAPRNIALTLNLDLALGLVLIPALAHTPCLISISLEIGLELNPLGPVCMILAIMGTGTIQGVPNPFHILGVRQAHHIGLHHTSSQLQLLEGEVHWCQNFLPVIVRGREVLKGRGIISGKVVLLGIGVFKVVVVLCLCILLAGVTDLGPVQLVAVSGMLYSPIPVGCWFIISLGPVPEGFQTPDVWLALYPQVIAACMEHKKGKVLIQLLFKRSCPCNELKVTLEGWAATRAAEVTTVMIDASHVPSECYTGLRDLEYIDQILRSQYREYFLNYDQYPPIIGPLIPRDQHLRRLQVVEFDTAWLVAQLAQLPIQTVDLHLCRMEMMIRAHSNCVMSVGFMTMMWPTSGPVDAIIRQICQLVNEGRSTTWAPNLLPDESFGFVKSPPVWHIKLDLNLEHPKYSKPAESLAL